MTLTKASHSMINGARINVLDFGADPTGVNDSSAAIQSAVNQQGDIFIPSGIYKIISDITIKVNTCVIFDDNAFFFAGADNVTFFKSTVDVPAYFSQIHNANLNGNGFSNVTGFDMYNFRFKAGLFRPFMTNLETGIILRYGCWGTVLQNPTTFDKVPFSIVIMDNCNGVYIENPNLDNTTVAAGSSIGIDIQVGATIGKNIGCIIQGGFVQGFNQGIIDRGYGTKINGTYFELCPSADIFASTAESCIYTGTQHWAGIGASAIEATNSDGLMVVTPLMGASNRSVGLLDFDATNSNCLFIDTGSSSFKNTPIGLTTGVSLSLTTTGLSSLSNVVKSEGQASSVVTATPTTIFSIVDVNRGSYNVIAFLAFSGSPSQYTAEATVLWDGSGGRVIANDGANLTITLSGFDIQVTHTAGSNQNVFWKIIQNY